MQETKEVPNSDKHTFTGNIYIFHAFDVGYDINLEKMEKLDTVKTIPLSRPKYFKNYHLPMGIELPHPHTSSKYLSCKVHNFGAISITYKIPFEDTLENVRKEINEIENSFQEQSVIDAKSIFKKIESCIAQPKFFQTMSSYLVIAVDPIPEKINITDFKKQYGGIIASALRFETQTLSEYMKNEIMESATGYFKGDLLVIDTDAAFVYDKEYEETLDFFEFANIQQLELQYYDRLLDLKLNSIYEKGLPQLPWRAYLPMISLFGKDQVAALGKLKADISVIVERLESSIKLVGEPYFSELYGLLVDKLDLHNWSHAIDRKLDIIRDIQRVYQHKSDAVREDILSVLIIILIFIELVVGILHYFK